MPEVLSPDQIASYDEKGYLVLENQIPPEWIMKIRDEIRRFEIEATTMNASNDRLDLEDSHTATEPAPAPHQAASYYFRCCAGVDVFRPHPRACTGSDRA